MKKVLKAVVKGILLLLALLFVADYCSMVVVDLGLVARKTKQNLGMVDDNRSELKNYQNVPWAKKHFEELSKLRSDYQSYYGWRRKPFKGETITIDTLGIRRTKGMSNPQSPPVVFLGGSTMFGSGSDDCNTIPSLFCKKTSGEYNAVNYGESGYNSYQSFIFLQTQLAKGLLDSISMIITYDGVNNAHLGRAFFTHRREKQIQKLVVGKDSEENYLFMHYTRVLAQNLKARFRKKTERKINGDCEQSAIELLESWLMMRTLATQYNADFICILQPNAFVGKPMLSNIEDALNYSRKDSYLYYENVRKLIEEDERYSGLKSHFIDMTSVFDSIPDVYIDFSHVSPNGNEIVVNKLLQYVR